MRIHPVVPALLLCFSSLVSNVTSAATACERGEDALGTKDYPAVVKAMSECIADRKQGNVSRRRALQARAWAHFSRHEDAAALADQESAYRIAPPVEKGEFINYGSYLRRVARFDASLRALKSAQEFDRKAGVSSMMTQYNLGWTFFELRRFDEAVHSFTTAIPLQPSFPFVYWRRALAYEALGRADAARADIEKAAALIVAQPGIFPEDAFTAALRAKIKEYGLGTKYNF